MKKALLLVAALLTGGVQATQINDKYLTQEERDFRDEARDHLGTHVVNYICRDYYAEQGEVIKYHTLRVGEIILMEAALDKYGLSYLPSLQNAVNNVGKVISDQEKAIKCEDVYKITKSIVTKEA